MRSIGAACAVVLLLLVGSAGASTPRPQTDSPAILGESQCSNQDHEVEDLQSELLDLYTEQIADLKRVTELLRQRLQLKDDVIDAQSVRIQGLLERLETEQRLSDARVAHEKAMCPRCPPKWLRRVTNGAAFAVGGLAGRGLCESD